MAGARRVTVNDRMQRCYHYKLSALEGEGFDPAFAPDLTPIEMLELGVFGGKYMTDCRAEFPAEWFVRARLSPEKADPACNHFGVLASRPICRMAAQGLDPSG